MLSWKEQVGVKTGIKFSRFWFLNGRKEPETREQISYLVSIFAIRLQAQDVWQLVDGIGF
jgi:hypothetical protein